jgi:hypothetical protein
LPEASLDVDGRALDAESVSWIEALSGGRADREEALERLHALLLRASRFEIARRRRTLGGDRASVCDDLALQAADDALMPILGKLHTFRGEPVHDVHRRSRSKPVTPCTPASTARRRRWSRPCAS